MLSGNARVDDSVTRAVPSVPQSMFSPPHLSTALAHAPLTEGAVTTVWADAKCSFTHRSPPASA